MGKAARKANRRQRRSEGGHNGRVTAPKVSRRRGDVEPSIEGLRRPEANAFDELVKLRVRLSEAEVQVAFWVAHARSAGVSWRSIGEALGVTQQAACKRFGRPVRLVEGGER